MWLGHPCLSQEQFVQGRKQAAVGWRGVGYEEVENSTAGLFHEVWQWKEVGGWMCAGLLEKEPRQRVNSQAWEICRGSKEWDQEWRASPVYNKGHILLVWMQEPELPGDARRFIGAGDRGVVPCFLVEQVMTRQLAESREMGPWGQGHFGLATVENEKQRDKERNYWTVTTQECALRF